MVRQTAPSPVSEGYCHRCHKLLRVRRRFLQPLRGRCRARSIPWRAPIRSRDAASRAPSTDRARAPPCDLKPSASPRRRGTKASTWPCLVMSLLCMDLAAKPHCGQRKRYQGLRSCHMKRLLIARIGVVAYTRHALCFLSLRPVHQHGPFRFTSSLAEGDAHHSVSGRTITHRGLLKPPLCLGRDRIGALWDASGPAILQFSHHHHHPASSCRSAVMLLDGSLLFVMREPPRAG